MAHAQTAAKQYGLSADKPKGTVKLSWTSAQLTEQMLKDLTEDNTTETLVHFGLMSDGRNLLASTDPLDGVFTRLFEYTPHIESVSMRSSYFEFTPKVLSPQANLKSFDSATGEFWLQVPLHQHLLARFCIAVNPLYSLLKSKNDLFDAMSGIKRYLFSLLDKKTESQEEAREHRQLHEIQTLFDMVQDAKPTELMLLVIQGMIYASKRKARSAVSINVMRRRLLELCPEAFPAEAKVMAILDVILEQNLVLVSISKKNLALSDEGLELLATLAKN